MIKKNGGIFGRNPTYYNVEVENDLRVGGDLIINGETVTGLDFEGSWDASTNTPDVTASPTVGQFWIVSVAGNTDLSGITTWDVGDWALYDGSAWQRVEGGGNGTFTKVNVDNLQLDGNTISSTDTNGNITLSPDGVGVVDITGTATADGLTINGGNTLRLNAASATDFFTIIQGGTQAVLTADSDAAANMLFKTASAGVDTDRMQILSNGDIVFYDSAGSSQSFFWDASAESLGIGTTSPTDALVVEGDVASPHRMVISNANASGAETLSFKQGATVKSWIEFDNSTSNFDVWQYTNNALRFGTNNQERMSIASSGLLTNQIGAVFNESGVDSDFRVESDNNSNMLFVDAGNDRVGVGTSSPNAKLSIDNSTSGAIGPVQSNTSLSKKYVFFGTIDSGQSLRIANTTGNVGRMTGLFYCKLVGNRLTTNTATDHYYAVFSFRVYGQDSSGYRTIEGLTAIAEYGITISTALTFTDNGSGSFHFDIASPTGNTTTVTLEMELLESTPTSSAQFSNTFTSSVV